MSCTRHVESFEVVEVRITFDKDCIKEIEKTAELLLIQKIEKLNILLKNLNVFCHNNILLVNDRYNICKDFEEIASAFALTVKPIACSLRGKNYIVSDKLIEILMTINENYNLKGVESQEATSEIIEIISKNGITLSENESLIEMLRAIRKTGEISTQGKQRVVTTYYDGMLRGVEKGEITSNSDQITEMIKSYVGKTTRVLEEGNKQLRDGTAKLLYSRARQMGYAVKEERKGNQIQLVLVRYE